jgi:hypothetical protein
MKLTFRHLPLLALALVAVGCSKEEPKFTAHPPPSEDGGTTLFNGKDLTGWKSNTPTY